MVMLVTTTTMMMMIVIVGIVNLFIVIVIFITAVCSTCRGAHYQSRKTRNAGCLLSGEQVS